MDRQHAENSRACASLAAGGRSHALLLEFVPNDDPAVLPDEAAELKRLINGG